MREAQAATRAYYRQLSPDQRLEILLDLIASRRDETMRQGKTDNDALSSESRPTVRRVSRTGLWK